VKFAILKSVLALTVFSASFGVLEAHEGEDHGTPEPVVAVTGEALLAATGGGAAFDAVLKYRPFSKGEQVALALYLVSSETNRPVGDATVSASLSDGDKSTTVTFQAKEGGPVGLYSAAVTPDSDATMSWLLDVTAGSDYDLIAISGFKAGEPPPGAEVSGTAHHAHDSDSGRRAILVSLGVLLLIAAFATGRFTARRVVSA